MRAPKSNSNPRIYFSLLALCYLEIVLWSVCLLSSHHGSGYLERETGNLKAFTGCEKRCELVNELAISLQLEHHHQLERASLQQAFNAWSVVTAALVPHAAPLRSFPAVQGLPAPFTGIQAID